MNMPQIKERLSIQFNGTKWEEQYRLTNGMLGMRYSDPVLKTFQIDLFGTIFKIEINRQPKKLKAGLYANVYPKSNCLYLINNTMYRR